MNPPEIDKITVADFLAFDRRAVERPIVWEADSWLRSRTGLNSSKEGLELRINPPITPWGRVDFEHFNPSYPESFEPTNITKGNLRLVKSQWEGVVVQPINTPTIKVVRADGQEEVVPNYWRTSFQALDEEKGGDDRTGYRDNNSVTQCLGIRQQEDGTFEAIVRRPEAICVDAKDDGVSCDTPGAQLNPGADHNQVFESTDGVNWSFVRYQE